MKTKKYVLIVEDDKVWGNIIKSYVKKNFNIECKIKKNYESSIKLLKSSSPLILILDLNLGNNKFNEKTWSGWHLAEAARKKHIPFIVVTAYPDNRRIIRAFKDFKVLNFFDKKDFADRIPEFIQDIEKVVTKTKTKRANASKGKKKVGTVFISYSRKDRKWLNKFNTNLKVLTDNKQLIVWDDTKIKSGKQWKIEIIKALSAAKVAILLVTPEFLASDFIKNTELPKIFKAAGRKKLTILWVAVKHSLYEETYIAEFESANDPSKPLNSLPTAKREQTIVEICQKIKEAVSP